MCVLCVCVIRISIKTQSLEKKNRKTKETNLMFAFPLFVYLFQVLQISFEYCVSLSIYFYLALYVCVSLYFSSKITVIFPSPELSFISTTETNYKDNNKNNCVNRQAKYKKKKKNLCSTSTHPVQNANINKELIKSKNYLSSPQQQKQQLQQKQ